MKNKTRLLFWLIVLITSISIIMFSCTNDQKDKENEMFAYERGLSDGKSIGRSSTLQYLSQSGQLHDTIKVDLFYVLKIEDSLESKIRDIRHIE